MLSGAGIQAWQAAQQQANNDIQYLAMGLIIAFTLIAAANTLIMAVLGRRREFARGMTGSWTPSVPAPAYLAVIACAAAVTFATTEAAARSVLRTAAPALNAGE